MDLPAETPYKLESRIPSRDWSTLLRPPFGKTPSKWYSNINEFPISFALRLRLRDRLTLGGLTFPRKPQVFGVPISYRNYRYLCRHIHFHSVHPDSRLRLHSKWNAPLRSIPKRYRATASVIGLSPATFSVQNHSTSELLRFL